jgi:hypothetical protein
MKNQPTHDQLIAKAKVYAEIHLRKQGAIPPMFLAVTPDESLTLFPKNVEDEKAKESFGFFARLTCAAHGAIGAMFVAEAWVSAIEPGEPPDLPLSDAFNRKESVLIASELMAGAQRHTLLPIIRTDAGTYFGLGEPETMPADLCHDRSTWFLPPDQLSESDRRIARALLETMQKPPAKNQPPRRK